MSSTGVASSVPLNSFQAALAKKGITSVKAVPRQQSGSPRKELYFADLNGYRLTSVMVSLYFLISLSLQFPSVDLWGKLSWDSGRVTGGRLWEATESTVSYPIYIFTVSGSQIFKVLAPSVPGLQHKAMVSSSFPSGLSSCRALISSEFFYEVHLPLIIVQSCPSGNSIH